MSCNINSTPSDADASDISTITTASTSSGNNAGPYASWALGPAFPNWKGNEHHHEKETNNAPRSRVSIKNYDV